MHEKFRVEILAPMVRIRLVLKTYSLSMVKANYDFLTMKINIVIRKPENSIRLTPKSAIGHDSEIIPTTSHPNSVFP
jgi:hypothetical protein